MPIYLGGGEIDKVYVGASLADAVYYQGEKVWPTTPTFEPVLIPITEPGEFFQPWIPGATKCDVVICSAGATGGFGWGGGYGEYSVCHYPDLFVEPPYDDPGTLAGASAEDFIYNGRTYFGGAGGATPGVMSHSTLPDSPGGAGAAPGGGGAGFTDYNFGGGATEYNGGTAGQWAAETLTLEDALDHWGDLESIAIEVWVGTGYPDQAGAMGGTGGNGAAYFWFYT